ncbi:hypothetical protein CF645_37380, partial [Burkholderia pseudomallei]
MVGVARAILTSVTVFARHAAGVGATLPTGGARVLGALGIGGAVGAVMAAPPITSAPNTSAR